MSSSSSIHSVAPQANHPSSSAHSSSDSDSDHHSTTINTTRASSTDVDPVMDNDTLPVCRVCRSDDLSLGPLFHPCRCTGSIAHVHQDCLSTWLSHSKKSSCELCGHLFSFEKVYKPGSPARPPVSTITFQAIKEILNFLLLAARATLVAICWLGIVPWTVVWVSTAYWKAADWFAFGFTTNAEHARNTPNNSFPATSAPILNQTSLIPPANPHRSPLSSTRPLNSTLTGWLVDSLISLDLDPNSIALDIFQGQLITCAIILSFVVVFLLREWILQNTPPPDVIRLAEDDELQQPPQPVHHEPVEDRAVQPPAENASLAGPASPDARNPTAPSSDNLAAAVSSTFHNLIGPDTALDLQRDDQEDVMSGSSSSNPSSTSSLNQLASVNPSTTAQTQRASSDFKPFYPLSPAIDQSAPTPGLLELADPGLSMPFYKPHDPLDPDLLSHRILVTSVYLLFLSEPSDAPLRALPLQSHHSGDPDDNQLSLMSAWSNLAKATMLHPSNQIPLPIRQLRAYVARSCTSATEAISQPLHQSLEFRWTSTLLSDPKVSKHIQYLFNTRSSTKAGLSQDLVRRNGLIYSLLSIFILIESYSVIDDRTAEGHEPVSDSREIYERIYDALRLFVLPLLDGRTTEHGGTELSELEADIHAMVRTYDPTRAASDAAEDRSDPASTNQLKDEIIAILVKQRILYTLINSKTFIRYIRGMTFDDNLFTNRRLKSTRLFAPNFLYPQGLINPENDLSEITKQLINLKSANDVVFQPTETDRPVDLIDRKTFEHKLLVTSIHLLCSGHEVDGPIAVLENPAFTSYLATDDGGPERELGPLRAWATLARNCIGESCNGVRRFRSRALGHAQAFQRIENEWLARLINDPLLAELLLAILPQTKSSTSLGLLGYHTPNFFILKLLYVYMLLDIVSSEPDSKTSCAPLAFDKAFHVLEEHLVRLRAELPESASHKVLEMVRETEFVLASCRSLGTAPTSMSVDLVIRAGLLAARMKKGIVRILVRQGLLSLLAGDVRFKRYASLMLSDANLFSHQSTNVELLVDESDDEDVGNVTDSKETVKGKGKATGQTGEEDQENVGDYPGLGNEQAVTISPLSKSLGAGSSRSGHGDRSSHVDAFNWLEVGEEMPKTAVTSRALKDTPHSSPRPAFQMPSQDGFHPVSPVGELPARAVGEVLAPVIPPAPRQPSAADTQPVVLPRAAQAEIVPIVAPDRGRPEVAVRANPGRLGPAERNGAIGAGLADGFVFEDGALNAGDDELMAEDIDGILELIGMKGSLLMLAQNVGLMTMLLSLSLLAFVHLPHMIGKVAVLSRAHRLLIPPLKGLLILQRFVHQLLDCVSDYVKSHLFSTDSPSSRVQRLFAMFGGQQKMNGEILTSQWPVKKLLELFELAVPQARMLLSRLSALHVVSLELMERVGERLNSIAYGSKPMDRALAVLLGYLELVVLSLVYLSSGLDQQRARFVSETIVNGMQQQLLIAKVGMFIFVELVIFPFLCGLLLNLTTIPIFAHATLASRLALYSSAPYSATLITWLAGTCFMFTFAILVSTCRESLRAGVCWWIRDPSDDRFNPIREILERPAWSQVKKIAASAVMYGTVIVFGLGAVVLSLVVFVGALPLRIHADRPLSRAALDLVIYQTLLPLFLDWFRPRSRLKRCLQVTSRWVAQRLRLTCYLYGERRITEETTLEVVYPPDNVPRSARFSPLRLLGAKRWSRGAAFWRRRPAGGSFARVPATDSVKVVPGRKMHIPVRADGVPIDPADVAIIEQQLAEARDEGGAGADQYTVVYLPPHFKVRMGAYVAAMWVAAVIVGWQVVGVPLMVGRVLLDRLLMADAQEPHDVYAYALGMVICALAIRGGEKLWGAYERAVAAADGPVGVERSAEEMRTRGAFEAIGALIRRTLHLVLFALAGVLCLPILSAVAVELYVLGPLKPKIPGLPTVYVVESWTYGCIYLSIAGRVVRILPNWVSSAQDRIMSRWRAGQILDGIKEANKSLIVPICVRLVLAIVVPSTLIGPIVVWIPERTRMLVGRLGGWEPVEGREWEWVALKGAYPMVLSWYSHYLTTKVCVKGVGRWVEKVRDERFLERRRLKNYEQPEARRRAGAGGGMNTASSSSSAGTLTNRS